MQDILDCKSGTKPENIPQDINAEIFFDFFPNDSVNIKFCGKHKRNAYKDILEIEKIKEKLLIYLGRNSLYNSLPEFLFHSIDRFDNISERDKKEKFAEEYSKQEREKEHAYSFFYPIDVLLFHLRLQVRERLSKYVESNIVIQNIILDRLSKEQKENRFIKKIIPYIINCKNIRGNRTLITLLLRKIFYDEGITINVQRKYKVFTDDNPRYDISEGDELGSLFIGNTYSDTIITYSISYWSDKDCDSIFLSFVNELEIFRQFVQDYFLSVDSMLEFDILKDENFLRISDSTKYNYLNYNTNI